MTFTRFCSPLAFPIRGDLSSIEIRSKADAIFAKMFENVLEVLNHQF